MLTIYEIDALGQWTGASREVDEQEGWTAEWTLAPRPPEAPNGQCALWASGGWHLRDWLDPNLAVSASEEEPEETV